MHDAVTVTLIILIAALLRRSLLTDPDATPGVRAGGAEKGSMALALIPVPADSPHPARRTERKR